MHISEGILSPTLVAGGWAVTMAGLTYGMRQTPSESVPRVALLSAAFFVVTFVRIPLGAIHLHLVATALAGILLGWSAFPAIFIALLLQAILFQLGGLAVLGANTLVMAVPSVVAHYLFAGLVYLPVHRLMTTDLARDTTPQLRFWIGAVAGVVAALTVTGNVLLMATFLIMTDSAYSTPALAAILFHIPLMLVEGGITALVVLFLFTVRRDILPGCKGIA